MLMRSLGLKGSFCGLRACQDLDVSISACTYACMHASVCELPACSATVHLPG